MADCPNRKYDHKIVKSVVNYIYLKLHVFDNNDFKFIARDQVYFLELKSRKLTK